jgi:chromosome segregation ATPase
VKEWLKNNSLPAISFLAAAVVIIAAFLIYGERSSSNEISLLKTENDASKAEIENLNNTIHDQNEEIASTQRKISSLEREKNDFIKDREHLWAEAGSEDKAEIDRLKRELRERGKDAAEANNESEGLKRLITAMQLEAMEKRKEIWQLSENLSERDEALNAASAEIEDMKQRIAEQGNALKESLNGALSEIESLKSRIAELDESAIAANAEIARLNGVIAAAGADRERLDDALAERDAEIASMKTEASASNEKSRASRSESDKAYALLSDAIDNLWVNGHIAAAHALAEEAKRNFPAKSEFADSAAQLQKLLDAIAGDPDIPPDIIIPQ